MNPRRHIENVRDELFSLVTKTIDDLNTKYAGREIMITSDYNGQPSGRSKKSLKGTKTKIRYFYFDGHGDLYVFIEGRELSLSIDEFEFVDDSTWSDVGLWSVRIKDVYEKQTLISFGQRETFLVNDTVPKSMIGELAFLRCEMIDGTLWHKLSSEL